MKTKIEKLFYRKEVLEYTLKQYEKGSQIYIEYCESIKHKLKNKDFDSDYEKLKLETELIESELIAKNNITNYKNQLMEYKEILIPEFEREKDNLKKELEKDEIDFIDYEQNSKDLAEYDLFGKTTPTPPNVELPKIISDIEKYIEILENYKTECSKELKLNSKGYNGAKLRKEMYDTILHITTLRKRLSERKEYYIDTFLPQYNKDLLEAERNLDKYIIIAKEIIKLNIDVKLKFLLDEYDKHKNDKETLWLFYTALKTRLSNIKSELNKSLKKPKIALMKEIF